MNEQDKKNIEKIKSQVDCDKDFQCVNTECAQLCKAKNLGLECYLECCETEPGLCKFSLHLGDGYLCDCLLRVYLAKSHKK